MFFYYCFQNKRWSDQICWDEQGIGKPGDLIFINETYYLSLGTEISRQEQLFGSKTLELIHRMVYRYYTSYKSVINLFAPSIPHYLKHILKSKTFKKKDIQKIAHFNSIEKLEDLNAQSNLVLNHEDKVHQALVVFPDLLSMSYRTNERDFILTSADGEAKKANYFHDLQIGHKNILLTTSANICMDYHKLTRIICYFPETWYYKYRQDPRIRVPEVLEKMAEIRKAELIFIRTNDAWDKYWI